MITSEIYGLTTILSNTETKRRALIQAQGRQLVVITYGDYSEGYGVEPDDFLPFGDWTEAYTAAHCFVECV